MVTAPITASERDLRALAAIVTEDRPDLPAGEGLPPSLLDDLLGLIPGDCLTVMGLDSGRQENWFGYDVPVEDDFGIPGDVKVILHRDVVSEPVLLPAAVKAHNRQAIAGDQAQEVIEQRGWQS